MVSTNQRRVSWSLDQSGRGRGRRVRGITLFGWLESKKMDQRIFLIQAGREIVNYKSQYLTSPKFLKIFHRTTKISSKFKNLRKVQILNLIKIFNFELGINRYHSGRKKILECIRIRNFIYFMVNHLKRVSF